jgi:methyl coenzyme M reductase subunit C-like uncharacterized protein (methanogenesis marker protein 7)
MSIPLAYKVKALLAARGKPVDFDPLVDCVIAIKDGVEVLCKWNETTLGPKPTIAQLDALSEQAAAIKATAAARNRDLAKEIDDLLARIALLESKK